MRTIDAEAAAEGFTEERGLPVHREGLVERWQARRERHGAEAGLAEVPSLADITLLLRTVRDAVKHGAVTLKVNVTLSSADELLHMAHGRGRYRRLQLILR